MLLRVIGMVFFGMSVAPCDINASGETTRVKNELLGPVRSVTVKKHGYSTTETYDRAGHLIEAVLDLTLANAATHALFQYDREGRLQEELALDPTGQLMYRKRIVYAQDPEGRDTASVTASDDGHFQSAEFSQYERRGHLWEQLWVSHSTAYKSIYDVLGNRIYSAHYRKGALLNELIHRYDAMGRLFELISYDGQGRITARVRNNYDETGQRTRSTTQTFGETDSRTWVTTYEYDALGNWVKEQTSEQTPASRPGRSSTAPIVEERLIEYYSSTDSDAVAFPPDIQPGDRWSAR